MDARSSQSPASSRTAFRRLAWAAAAGTLALVTLGGVVRLTGSGMGCGDDWPLCHGRLIPPLDAPTLIEYGHRLVASLVSLLVLALLALAWTRCRAERRLRGPATLAAGLLLAQVMLGALAVWLRLPAGTIVLHFATAMLLLATLTLGALRAGDPAARPPSAPASDERARTTAPGGARVPDAVARLAWTAASVGFATVLLGGLVANLDAGLACRGFPLCNGTMLPAPQLPVLVHWTHRIAAFTLLGLLVGVFGVTHRRQAGAPLRVRRLSSLALAAGLLQVAIAAAMVLRFLPIVLRAAHLAAGALLWACLVAFVHAVSTARRASAAGVHRPTAAGLVGSSTRRAARPRLARRPGELVSADRARAADAGVRP